MNTTSNSGENVTGYLDDLHASLDQRWRPEDVLYTLTQSAPAGSVPPLAHRFAAARPRSSWSSMTSDFDRPVGAGDVLASVERATQASAPHVDVDDPEAVRTAASIVGGPLGWTPDSELGDETSHLTREQRAEAGITLSRRQYNRQWRAVRRLNRKADRLAVEQEKRDLILIGRAGFTTRITAERFANDPLAAYFIAYWVARKNVRRQFTLSGKQNPMDEVAVALLAACEQNPDTDWEMIAWARPTPDVLARLTDAQKGDLLAQWVTVLRRASRLLEQSWDPTIDRTNMIVRRGQDSSTWNTIAQAYNAARAAWLTCITEMGAEDLLKAACPGKAMRLMAADLAYWHRSSGGDVDPNTRVWANLPLPWEVLDGARTCTSADVEHVCREAGLDPQGSGWTAPKQLGTPAPFSLTPELVHGVTVADPVWAGLLRRAGVFSGKRMSDDPELVSAAAVGLAHGVVTSDLPNVRLAPDD